VKVPKKEDLFFQIFGRPRDSNPVQGDERKLKKKKPTFSEWLSFIAISISAIALILSTWQAFMFREHSQLTVRPVLDVEKQYFKEGYNHLVRIVIKNDGFGPAIVDSNLFIFDSKTIDELVLYGCTERLGFIRGCKISQIADGFPFTFKLIYFCNEI